MARVTGNKVHHRIFATLLGIGILALLVSTASLVVNSAFRSRPASSVSVLPAKATPLDVTSFLAGYLKNKQKITTAEVHTLWRPYITFTAATLDPSQDALTGNLEVVLPPAVPPFIKALSGSAVFSCTVTPCTVLPKYANDNITVSVLVTGAGANFEKFIPIALKDFSAGSNLGLHEFPITIPLKGFSGWYPQDNYSANLTLAMILPLSMQQIFASGPHSLVHTVDGGTVANTYAFSVRPTPKSFQGLESQTSDTFAISIARDWYNGFFVFTVALIPILFALLFFHLLFFAGGGHGIGRSFEHFTEALVVSILSVLPLRVVLVPGDISGLTRVDLVLGAGLVLIVTVAAGKYAREIWTGTQSPPEEDEAEHASRSVFPIHDEGDAHPQASPPTAEAT